MPAAPVPDESPLFPLPGTGGNKNKKAQQQLDELNRAKFSAFAVEPHSTQSGFLFFDIEDIRNPVQGAHIYLTGVRDAGGTELMYFDIPVLPASGTRQPRTSSGSRTHQRRTPKRRIPLHAYVGYLPSPFRVKLVHNSRRTRSLRGLSGDDLMNSAPTAFRSHSNRYSFLPRLRALRRHHSSRALVHHQQRTHSVCISGRPECRHAQRRRPYQPARAGCQMDSQLSLFLLR